MDNIQHIIEFNYDFLGVRTASDLTQIQRELLIREFVKQKSTHELTEALLEIGQPSEMPRLLARLFESAESRLNTFIISDINTSIDEMLRNYYDVEIDERLSDYRWQIEERRRENMTKTNDRILRHEMETPYGMGNTLGAT